ncbi:type II toxin-antitoxin system HicA family toxin [Desulfobacula sp.]|uniref:type II toxin-antitoxin system HicA family toxin n=1 Tax=Desulfobacula sp. TaxID=2593537 RepID=UPI001ED79997|nr:type II toxin-antitoxin system HicA family toxin [Desulfobacula sp.]
MKYSEAVKLLKKSGYSLYRQGKKHEIWRKEGHPQIELPRHKKDDSKGVSADILKKLKG